MKALIISADRFEDLELLVPYFRLKEEDIEVDVATIGDKKKIKGERGYEVDVTKSLDDVNPEDYDLLVLPGGRAPEAIRKDKKAIDIAKTFFEKNKLVSAICHGPQLLISAGVLKGRHSTSYKTVSQELKDAGAIYEDKEFVVDKNYISSRQPSDLPYFLKEMMKKVREIKKY